jgi:branched-chain amino acid transport system permease protein
MPDSTPLAVQPAPPAAAPLRGWRMLHRAEYPYISAVVVLLAAFVLALPDYWVTIASQIFLLAGLAAAWNLVGGLMGYVSLASQAFYGLGAYGLVVAISHFHIAVVPAFIVSLLVGAVASIALGVPTLRLRGHYFVIGSFAAGTAIGSVFSVVTVFGTIPGGTIYLPISDLSAAEFDRQMYWITLGGLGISLALFVLIRHSRAGLGLAALRANETAAESLGVPAFGLKLAIFGLSGALTGLLGGIAAYQSTQVDPAQVFDIGLLIEIVVAVILGGIGTTWGPVLGAAFVVIASQLSGSLQTVNVIVYAAVVIVVVLIEPGGLAQLLTRVARLVMATVAAVARAGRVAPDGGPTADGQGRADPGEDTDLGRTTVLKRDWSRR